MPRKSEAEFWARWLELEERKLMVFKQLADVLDDLARRLSAPLN